MPLRDSHENTTIQTLYKELPGKPLGEKSYELLHTHYQAREKSYLRKTESCGDGQY